MPDSLKLMNSIAQLMQQHHIKEKQPQAAHPVEGSPLEEASESPAKEAFEQNADPKKKQKMAAAIYEKNKGKSNINDMFKGKKKK